MWKERSSSVLPLMHMGFGVGALIAPIVCSPFLASIAKEPDTTNLPGKQQHIVTKQSHVQQAYLLIGVFTFAASLPFYIFQCRKSLRTKHSKIEESKQFIHEKPKRFKEMLNPANYADGDFQFGLFMHIILFTYYFNLVGGEKAVGSFVRTVSVDRYRFEKDEASMVHTGFWLSLTVGRLASAILSHFIPVTTFLTLQVVLHLCSAGLLCQYGLSGAENFTVLTWLEGLCVAPLYPQGVAYGNTQMDMTGASLMVIVFSGAFGDMVYLWVAGWAYDTHGPQALFYLSTLAAAILVLCVVLFRSISRKRGHTFPRAIPNFETRKSICARLRQMFRLL